MGGSDGKRVFAFVRNKSTMFQSGNISFLEVSKLQIVLYNPRPYLTSCFSWPFLYCFGWGMRMLLYSAK